ncbi:hypothetical protein PLEOSDRAFT_1104144 [Pleurotus ostreatus PC15]|uniref:DUF5648 domain-containing protein n=1 Tax=Pleurotus ostreatus (strain PC15) TaxID=1137138 RepID=A0A067NV06_PLEO1|nr:hypothetical protein PLEOSDRAFT_1104144 [Pleurotus ostreatus PC15]
MKFSFGLIASAFLAVQAAALPSSAEVAKNLSRDAAICPTFNFVPALFSAYNSNLTDHYYATSELEMLKIWVKRGYTPILVNARIFEEQKVSTVPLFRLYNKAAQDHYYTIDEVERQEKKNQGYEDKAIVGYVYASPICGSTPWHRMYNTKLQDHYYTPDPNQVKDAVSRGYVWEAIAAYVYMP